MHESKPPRTIDAIDRDLSIERVWWQREVRRTGSTAHHDAQTAAARIDQLLDERSALRHLVPDLPDPPPRPLDGPVVHDA
jgi:hypothetical protein